MYGYRNIVILIYSWMSEEKEEEIVTRNCGRSCPLIRRSDEHNRKSHRRPASCTAKKHGFRSRGDVVNRGFGRGSTRIPLHLFSFESFFLSRRKEDIRKKDALPPLFLFRVTRSRSERSVSLFCLFLYNIYPFSVSENTNKTP